MKRLKNAGMTAAAVLAGILPAAAGTFTSDFNTGLPPGATLFGDGASSGIIDTVGGVGDSGCVKLTKSINGLAGAFFLEDLDAGGPVNGFTANFKMKLGGGSAVPADGGSFCVAGDLADGAFGEAGTGTGLKVVFDIYDNVDGDPNNAAGEAPAFNIYWNNALISQTRVPLSTIVTNTFVDVMVRINQNGTLDFSWNGAAIHTGLYIGYQPIFGARYAWGARTGGLNTNQFLDDVSITSTTGDLQPYIARHPISVRVANGYGALLNVVDSGVAGVTYQWERKGPGEASFSVIPGANASVYTSPALSLADAGTSYRVVLTSPGGTAVSNPAVVDVVTLNVGSPTASYTFNDGTVPAGTNAYGNALALPDSGFAGTGCMQLTNAVNGEAGTWTVDDLNTGGPVESIEVAFKLRMSDGTAPPADGFGFHWAPDLPAAGFPGAEEPVGNGLSVAFDVYDNTDGNPNNGGEAPAIDVFWLRNRVGGVAVPIEFLNTAGGFQDVIIRLSAAGKIDVMFNGIVLVYQLQVPNWTAFSAAKYGFAARTGGLNQIHAIDEVSIRSTPYAGPIAVISPPQSQTVLVGRTATFSVTTNDPSVTSYQWQSKPLVAANFADIGGAIDQTYTTGSTVALDSGTQYRCLVSSSRNGTTATSDPATLTVLDLARPGAPQINDTFDDGATPTNTGSAAPVQTLSGNAIILPDSGTAGTGCLRLTELVNSQFGTLVIDDFNAGGSVGSFTAAVNLQITGGNPADGWSFNWSDTIAPAQAYTNFERGVGDDLRIGFITYAPNGIGVEVYWQGVMLTKSNLALDVLQTPGGGVSEELLIQFKQNATGLGAVLNIAQDGQILVGNLAIPGFQGLANGRFAIGARTGGLNEEHIYDDLAIRTEAYTGPISITQQPAATSTIIQGRPATLTVVVNDPARTAYQWQVSSPGGGAFTNVASGGNAATYVTPALTPADSGTTYQCICTATTNTLTSNPAVVNVIDPAYPTTWERLINFNDGALPPDGAVFGSATVMGAGGVGGTGMVQLTPAVNDQQGVFALADQDAGNSVSAFSARFRLRIGDATNPPADGCSFIWSPEPITGGFGEEGAGSGLVVSFDTYDNNDGNPENGVGEAPAIEARWNGNSLGNLMVPLTLLQTDADFVEVFIRINPEGTLDVFFDNFVAFWHTPITGFTPLAGATFGWGGRTGGLNAAHEIDEIELNTLSLAPPVVQVGRSGGNIVITYDGILQSAGTIGAGGIITGWTDVPGATSPYTAPLGGGPALKYWRARR